MIEKRYLTANEYLKDIWKLAFKIRSSSWRPDLIIALWRGGAPVALGVDEFFKASGWKIPMIPLKCSSYCAIANNPGEVEFILGEETFALIHEGDRVLVLDDIFDSGKTARAVKEKVVARRGDFRFAAVYWKKIPLQSDIEPDYFVENAFSEWLVYPHEIEGLDKSEIEKKDSYISHLLEGLG